MKIQIVSDLHLEFRDKNIYDILIPSAPILCMVGDICACGSNSDFKKLLNFLKYFCPKFEAILHVAGNHEYYTLTTAKHDDLLLNIMPKIEKRLDNLTKIFPNYYFLNNSVWKFTSPVTKKKYIFVGTSLWTNIPKKIITINEGKQININLEEIIQKKMNDYKYIYVADKEIGYRKFTVADMQKKHKQSLNFIKKIINIANKSDKYILLTHHKPLFDRNTDEQDEFTFAYENNLANIILVPPFIAAVHGHTHIHYNKKINGVHVVSNPKGYPGEPTKFNPKFTINI
jgi:predicted phosphodiesterase